MVVIFGWGDGRSKDLGEVAPTTCPKCRNDVFLHEVESDRQFSLYFIPLGSYKHNIYLLCPICQFGVQLRPEDRATVANMRAATSVYRRGKVDANYYRTTVEQFWGRLGTSPSGVRMLHVPGALPTGSAAATASAEARGPTLAEQIKSLAKLRDEGVLTEAEFTAAKRRVMEQ